MYFQQYLTVKKLPTSSPNMVERLTLVDGALKNIHLLRSIFKQMDNNESDFITKSINKPWKYAQNKNSDKLFTLKDGNYFFSGV